MTFCKKALLTDLYQITMAAAYFEKQINHESTFELFVRGFPENRSFLIAAGINQCLEYMRDLAFEQDEIEYIKSLLQFKNVSPDFFSYLEHFRFTGDVWAIDEGTVFFPQEPVLRVTAPAIEAQILETYLLSMFNFQTLVATKAARICQAAEKCQVMEFGTRRAHSPEAGLFAARASYIGGCVGTSNMRAGQLFNIPVFGTMAHSWVMCFDDEKDSFNAYSEIFPNTNILLIDTYDTLAAARIVSKLDYKVIGVRLDSGNMLELSKEVRNILDKAGKNTVKIVVSGDLNEYKIQQMLNNSAPIDMFGVGTELATSKDAPALAGVYKLVENVIDGKVHYKIKFSEEKSTYPGKKQVYRFMDNLGNFDHDLICNGK